MRCLNSLVASEPEREVHSIVFHLTSERVSFAVYSGVRPLIATGIRAPMHCLVDHLCNAYSSPNRRLS